MPPVGESGSASAPYITFCMNPVGVRTCRQSRQLSADVQHDAVHVLQHQRPLYYRVTQRLQLLAVDSAADDTDDGSGHRISDTRLHQPLFRLRSTDTGQLLPSSSSNTHY